MIEPLKMTDEVESFLAKTKERETEKTEKTKNSKNKQKVNRIRKL